MNNALDIEEYRRLNIKLKQKMQELNALAVKVRSTTGNAVTDSNYETVEYEEYIDQAKASLIKQEIETIKKLIGTCPISQTRFSKEQQERFKKFEVGRIMTSAKETYDQKMQEYMEMNFWGKAKTMFAGKKPKTNATSAQIMKDYGEEAKVKEMQPELNRMKREYEEIVEWLKSYYEVYPEELTTSLEERLEREKAIYEKNIKEIQAQKDNYLKEANEVVRTGAVKL